MNEEFNFHMLLRWKLFSNCCFADMCWELLVEQLAIIFRVLVLLVNIFFVCQCWYYRWSWDCRVNYLMKARKYAETCRSVKLKLKLFFKLCWSGRVINLMHYVNKFDVNEIIVFDSVIVITIAPQLTFGADHCRDWSCRIAVLTPSNNASTFPPQPSQCSQQACLGSVVSLHTRNTGAPRSREEVLRHAKDFLDQYFTSIRRSVYIDLQRMYPEVDIHLEILRAILAPCRFDMNKSVEHAMKIIALKEWGSAYEEARACARKCLSLHWTVTSLHKKPNALRPPAKFAVLSFLTLTLLTWRIGWAPNNARRWQMGFNSAFKGLNSIFVGLYRLLLS